ncbi:hypothetical protein STCU_11955 [Strigomonas culicis]|uniref:Uncharacterized protein n=1 Tax=Strigomonas culicis TaxID=28005 RepID=S9TBZ5_9TRYP|nr:hypothetical protein STCU_11955 [Strigomonas culicis]|eukprot:EPY15522.1 hypothetical protein STCU_11955 [Strigomonas culicis]
MAHEKIKQKRINLFEPAQSSFSVDLGEEPDAYLDAYEEVLRRCSFNYRANFFEHCLPCETLVDYYVAVTMRLW